MKIFSRTFLIFVVVLTSRVGLAAASNSSFISTGTSQTSGVNLNASGGLVTMGGNYGGTFLLGVSIPVSRTSPVRVGLDSGVTFASGTAIPILLSVLYEFGDRHQTARPYLGGAIGPEIGVASGTRNVYGVNVPNPNFGEEVKLAILVRPGLRFNVTDLLDINVESALGGITGVFYIAPTVGASIRL
jgi:hypothetical protein